MSVAYRSLIYDINKKRTFKNFKSNNEKEQYTEYIEEYLSNPTELTKILKENDTLTSLMNHKLTLILNYLEEFLFNLIDDIDELKIIIILMKNKKVYIYQILL